MLGDATAKEYWIPLFIICWNRNRICSANVISEKMKLKKNDLDINCVLNMNIEQGIVINEKFYHF